ncbi:MAG TPA: alpha/beta hydrolase [Chthoniobacterales bacterium]
MISFLRWFGRVVFALLVVVLLAGIYVAVQFEDWKKGRLAELDAGSKIVATAAGDVEYAERGAGPPVLVIHGAPGGYDQALLIGDTLAKDGFRVIAPSRPGFLRTPFTTGFLFEDQADALAALLDTLQVPRVAVLGFSTGSPVAVQFALRHPDRTSALALLSPVAVIYDRAFPHEPSPLLSEAALLNTTGDMGSWFFLEQMRRDPRWMLDATFSVDTDLGPAARGRLVDFVLGNPSQLTFLRGLLNSQAPLSLRESGTRNDILQLRRMSPVPYDKLTVPTLVVTGSADGGRKWVDPKAITTALPSARTLAVADAGHLVWFGPNAAAAQQAVVDFLKAPPPLPTPTPPPASSPTPASPAP